MRVASVDAIAADAAAIAPFTLLLLYVGAIRGADVPVNEEGRRPSSWTNWFPTFGIIGTCIVTTGITEQHELVELAKSALDTRDIIGSAGRASSMP